jgi:hypothetical protein
MEFSNYAGWPDAFIHVGGFGCSETSRLRASALALLTASTEGLWELGMVGLFLVSFWDDLIL